MDEDEKGPIQTAIDAIDEVLNVHKNHLFPNDYEWFTGARAHLVRLQDANFK